MIRRNELRVMLCIVLSLLMVVDFTVFNPAPAFALETKSVLIGAGVGVAAGAGIVLAAPAIGAAVGAAAGGVAVVGASVVGGVAAVSGGVIGALAGFGGAIASALGAVGGFIAGIFASPLFIPALIIIGAAVAGYFLYKKYIAKKTTKGTNSDVLPGSDDIFVTPGDYEMTGVVPAGDEASAVSVGDSAIITIGAGDAVSVSNELPATVAATAAQAPTTTTTTTAVTGVPTTSDSLKAAHDRYIATYQKYTTMVTNSGGVDPTEVKAALAEYRSAYNDYQNLRATGSK